MSRGDAYYARLTATLEGVVEHLRAKGIVERHLSFGGEGQAPARKPTVPTDARSEFLANRAMGDWAEKVLSAALVRALPELKVVQYGSTDRIAAGHPEFKTRYLAGLEETRRFGKRPDLLLFPAAALVAADLSEQNHTDTEPLVKQAVSAVEVRSSKFEALTYIAVRKRQRDAGKSTGRETPSFTVKLEDLLSKFVNARRALVQRQLLQLNQLARHFTRLGLAHLWHYGTRHCFHVFRFELVQPIAVKPVHLGKCPSPARTVQEHRHQWRQRFAAGLAVEAVEAGQVFRA